MLGRGHGHVPRQRKVTATVIGAVLVGVALTASACGSSPSASGGSGGKAATNGTHITIENFAFSPTPMTVTPGATVTVSNEDSVTHTLTSTSGKFNTGDIAPGSSKTFAAPTKPGNYPYICEIHQYMTGTLVVS